jgi:hypothetical protein
MSFNMGYLNKTRAYLVGNIQNASIADMYDWRAEFKEKTKSLGIISISPMDKVFLASTLENGDFKNEIIAMMDQGNLDDVYKLMKRIIKKDLRCVDISTFLVGIIDVDKPTFGTTHEIILAAQQSKRIMLVIKQGIKRAPWWLLGLLGPRAFYNSLDEVINELKDLDSGKLPIEEKYWQILEPELQ